MTTVRKKTGGRTKGTPNKKTEELLELIENTGCMHPITGLAKIAQQTYNSGDFATSMGAFKELAQYVAPKRKAIEHTSNDPQEAQSLNISFEVREPVGEVKVTNAKPE